MHPRTLPPGLVRPFPAIPITPSDFLTRNPVRPDTVVDVEVYTQPRPSAILAPPFPHTRRERAWGYW